MTKYCKVCAAEIHPRRLKALPHTETCVDCSDAKPYKAVNVTLGEGDHTWNDIQILTDEQYRKYNELEKQTRENIKKIKEIETLDSTDEDLGIDLKAASITTVDDKEKIEEDPNDDEELFRDFEPLDLEGLENLDLDPDDEE